MRPQEVSHARAPRRLVLGAQRVPLLAAALALLASACGIELPAPSDQAWTGGVREAPSEVEASAGVPVVRAVRTGTHAGFDRVTIELAGSGMPGYHVEYVDKPLHQCGSGAEVFPVGQGWLEVRLEPAQAHTDEGAATLPGREIAAAGRLLRRIYVTCDFEGVVSLVLALDAPNRFQVATLREPGRIVVDVVH